MEGHGLRPLDRNRSRCRTESKLPGRPVASSGRIAQSIPGATIRILGFPGRVDDRRCLVRRVDSSLGREDQVLAALGRGPRSLISDLMRSGTLKIESGEITWAARKAFRQDHGTLVMETNRLIALGKALRFPPSKVPSKLASNALTDAIASVRLKNLERLIASYPQQNKTREAAGSLLESSEPHIQLVAALYLNSAEATAVLRSLAIQRGLDVELRDAALAGLTSRIPRSEALELLQRILTDPESVSRMRITAIEATGRLGLKELLPLLLREVVEADDDELIVLADAIGAVGDPTAEAALLSIFNVERIEARVAVINALGMVGSASAVDDLHALTHGLAQPGSVAAAARGAIARIQSRLLGAGVGQLSLSLCPTPEETGTLSLSDDDRGKLSVPQADRPQRETEVGGEGTES